MLVACSGQRILPPSNVAFELHVEGHEEMLRTAEISEKYNRVKTISGLLCALGMPLKTKYVTVPPA